MLFFLMGSLFVLVELEDDVGGEGRPPFVVDLVRNKQWCDGAVMAREGAQLEWGR